MEGLKKELLEREKEVNDTLEKQGIKLDFAVTWTKGRGNPIKDIVREYIKIRFPHVEKYVDNRIEYKKNGGHTSLTTKNTSPT
jgi:hypothetical protein